MSDHCLFPTCRRHPEKNGYCIGHRIYANGVAVVVPKETNKVSDKMKDIKKALKSAYPAFLSRHPMCEIKSPECTHKATVIHHTKGRSADKVLDQKTWAASCVMCNGYVEQFDGWAREKGFKESKFS